MQDQSRAQKHQEAKQHNSKSTAVLPVALGRHTQVPHPHDARRSTRRGPSTHTLVHGPVGR